jgi:pantothenate kinase
MFEAKMTFAPLLHLWLATGCHGFLSHHHHHRYHHHQPTMMIQRQRQAPVVSLRNVLDIKNFDVGDFDVEDSECEATYTENSMTSTFSQGTEESDIILSWEPDVAEKIREEVAKRGPTDIPFLCGIVGNPGSGKTTSCYSLKELLSDIGCVVMPFDGYHIAMAELEAEPNAEDLIYRRGAPDTFSPEKLLKDVNRIKTATEESIVMVPGFDHEKGDPEPDEHEFRRDEHKIVLVEGLYLLHDGEIWKDLNDLFDYSIFVNADVDVCMERLKIRNQCIPGYTKEEIEIRCEVVDRANAMTVERSKARASICVDSAAQRTITTTISDGTPESDIKRTWEADVAERIRKALEERPASAEPYVVSISGGPGSGKTTSCQVLSEMLEDVGCTTVPFDGYHKPLSMLEKEPNAADLLYRRGAPDTFDTHRLMDDLKRIRSGQESLVPIPGFNHAIGDPEENVHQVEPHKHKVVLCEGLYFLHDDEEWKDMKNMFDFSIFMDADADACVERLKIRNKCVPGSTEEEIELRAETVDRVNANVIDRSKARADLLVESVAQDREVGLVV